VTAHNAAKIRFGVDQEEIPNLLIDFQRERPRLNDRVPRCGLLIRP
jgi:hypothetical protein